MLSLPAEWSQGQHLAIIGQTGTGKTTLARAILDTRTYLLALQSKERAKVEYGGIRVKRARDMDRLTATRVELRPPYERQYEEFATALIKAYHQGGWTIYLDELYYLDQLGLSPFIDRILTQGREDKLTIVSGMQRPVKVTRFAISQSTHVVSFHLEGRDAKTLADATTPRLEEIVSDLGEHEFVWYKQPATLWRGKLDMRAHALVGEEI